MPQIANLENQATRNARNSAREEEEGEKKVSDRQQDELLNKQAKAHAGIGLIFIVSVVHSRLRRGDSNGDSDKATFRAIDTRSSSLHL